MQNEPEPVRFGELRETKKNAAAARTPLLNCKDPSKQNYPCVPGKVAADKIASETRASIESKASDDRAEMFWQMADAAVVIFVAFCVVALIKTFFRGSN